MHQTCTLLTANVPSSVGYLYKFATRSDPEDSSTRRSLADATHKAAVIRESALKSTIFIGVPRVRCSIRTRRNWILESYTHAPDIGHLIFGRTGGSHGGRCESQFADRLEEVCYSSASVPSTRPPQACSCLQDKRYEEWPQGWGAIMKPIHTLTIRFRPPSTTLQNRDSREHQRDFG